MPTAARLRRSRRRAMPKRCARRSTRSRPRSMRSSASPRSSTANISGRPIATIATARRRSLPRRGCCWRRSRISISPPGCKAAGRARTKPTDLAETASRRWPRNGQPGAGRATSGCGSSPPLGQLRCAIEPRTGRAAAAPLPRCGGRMRRAARRADRRRRRRGQGTADHLGHAARRRRASLSEAQMLDPVLPTERGGRGIAAWAWLRASPGPRPGTAGRRRPQA